MTEGNARTVGAVLLAAISAFATPASARSLEDATSAYEQQEYAASFAIAKELAENGDARAQYLLGRHFQFGQGVKGDRSQAFFWYRRAESSGHVEAKLFRHLLETHWNLTARERTEAERRLAGLRTVARAEAKPGTASELPTAASAKSDSDVISPPEMRLRDPAPAAAERIEIRPDPPARAELRRESERSKPAPPARDDVETIRRDPPRFPSRLASRVSPREPVEEEDEDAFAHEEIAPAPVPPARPVWSATPPPYAYPPPRIAPGQIYRPSYYWHPGWRFRAVYQYPPYRYF
jgi:hypothetical protein